MKQKHECQDVLVEAQLGQAANEYNEQLDRGESPAIDEYVARYPEIATIIREVFPALDLLRDSSESDAGGASQEIDPAEQTCLGDFRLLREIGRGGMGVVYEATQTSLGRTVALKVLRFAGILDDRQLKRFKNEAQAAAALDHANIVPIYFVGSDRGVHFYAMQLIEGQSMAEVIDELRDAEGKPVSSYGLVSVSLSRDTPHVAEPANGKVPAGNLIAPSQGAPTALIETRQTAGTDI